MERIRHNHFWNIINRVKENILTALRFLSHSSFTLHIYLAGYLVEESMLNWNYRNMSKGDQIWVNI